MDCGASFFWDLLAGEALPFFPLINSFVCLLPFVQFTTCMRNSDEFALQHSQILDLFYFRGGGMSSSIAELKMSNMDVSRRVPS